jgi:hypothetical protein
MKRIALLATFALALGIGSAMATPGGCGGGCGCVLPEPTASTSP